MSDPTEAVELVITDRMLDTEARIPMGRERAQRIIDRYHEGKALAFRYAVAIQPARSVPTPEDSPCSPSCSP